MENQVILTTFLLNVLSMVNDPNSDDLIRWSTDGKSFFVVRHEDFARSVLPRFFKHSNFSSFVRQLNMYGFHKVPHLQHGVLHSDSDSEQWEFSNPHFQRNQPDLLLLVTRKKGRDNDDKELNNNNSNNNSTAGTSSSKGSSTSSTNLDLQHIMEEIQVIKQHQMNISSQLKDIQNDNSILWQETISAQERHQRHQDTIDKILRFLASVFSNDKSMAIPRKRRYLLEAPDTDNKDQQDIEYKQNGIKDKDNNGRPSKVQKTRVKPEFKLEDFVSGLQECDETTSSSSLPSSQAHYNKSTDPNSELADAIALHDKSKQSSSLSTLRPPMQLPHDITQVMSPQQIQGLQSLISLAQSNPALLSQLTTDVFNTYHQNNHTTNNNITTSVPATTTSTKPDYSHFSQPSSSSVAAATTSFDPASIPSSLYSVLQPQLTQQPFNLTNTGTNRYTPTNNQRGIMPAAIQPRPTSTTNTTNSIEALATTTPITTLEPLFTPTTTTITQQGSTTPFTSPASSTAITPNENSTNFIGSYLPPPSSNNNIDDLNSDIDMLGSNIEALAQQLGFDPNKTNDDILGYVDMDKFLQAYDANVQDNMDNIYPPDTSSQAGPVSPSAETQDKTR
ncbi:hypothetical protein BC941DRAFT_98164 [Chlamydoabsidia padenii]|nr:hypothetical protein BC941DRAFT_98164 [Chlamydoabsidia padenii]